MRHSAPKSHGAFPASILTLALLGVLSPELPAQEMDFLPDAPVVTQHTAVINGQTVQYTAEAGTLPIRGNGKVMARMFYVYYQRDNGPEGVERPLFYSFNGGPGTVSVWMHMGYMGPRRVSYDEEGFVFRPPVGLEDNPNSILDVADIVYIDPVATGFGRVVEGEEEHMYHGTLSDIASVGEFIRLFTLRKNRWASPRGRTRNCGTSSSGAWRGMRPTPAGESGGLSSLALTAPGRPARLKRSGRSGFSPNSG